MMSICFSNIIKQSKWNNLLHSFKLSNISWYKLCKLECSMKMKHFWIVILSSVMFFRILKMFINQKNKSLSYHQAKWKVKHKFNFDIKFLHVLSFRSVCEFSLFYEYIFSLHFQKMSAGILLKLNSTYFAVSTKWIYANKLLFNIIQCCKSSESLSSSRADDKKSFLKAIAYLCKFISNDTFKKHIICLRVFFIYYPSLKIYPKNVVQH